MSGRSDATAELAEPSAHEYIAAIAAELADMARDVGDRRLAHVLDLAATFAEKPHIDRH